MNYFKRIDLKNHLIYKARLSNGESKELCQQVPDYAKKYNEKYYQQNKAKRLAAVKEKVHCDICNCYITKGRLQKHKNTENYMTYMNLSQEEPDSDSDPDSDDDLRVE
jgi:hypothetical protein